jgi:hypothetical protein
LLCQLDLLGGRAAILRAASDASPGLRPSEASERFSSGGCQRGDGVQARPLPENVVHAVRRAHGGRSPGEAGPQLDILREAGIPALVASGDHASFLERAADALATELNAERLVAPGAGHFVAAAPGFRGSLERFLTSAD